MQCPEQGPEQSCFISGDKGDDFDFSVWENADAAIDVFKAHHQVKLIAQGVQFGRDHYKLCDVHSKKDLMSLWTKDEDFG